MIKNIKVKILAKNLSQVHHFLSELYHKGLIDINADGHYYVKHRNRTTTLPIGVSKKKNKFDRDKVLQGRGEKTNDKEVIKKILKL